MGFLTRSISDEALCKKLFDDYVTHLSHKAKEKERRREKEEKVGFIHILLYSMFTMISVCAS